MPFEIRSGYHSDWLPRMLEIYNQTDLKRGDPNQLDRAFQGSFAVRSAWDGSQLLGIGRMISDGAMNSMIYDLVVDPSLQKAGIGKAIMSALIGAAPGTRIYLGATFGNEAFYYKLGFRKHRTAMGLYPFESPYLDYDWLPPGSGQPSR